MAEADRRKNPAVSEQLLQRGYEFEFFQAVRLLELLAADEEPARGKSVLVGRANSPREERLRFGVPATSSFPAGSVVEVRSVPGKEPEQPRRTRVDVSFLGLTGPSGVLPQHYTNLVIARAQAGDHTLREFLDIFHHQAVGLFFEAWRKYRFPFAYEAFRTAREEKIAWKPETSEDLFTFCLRSLVGLGTRGLARRLAVDDQAVFYYAGHYSQQVRSAIGLEGVLRDFFALPASVQQFQGRWINLPRDQMTCLPTAASPRGNYCSLGRETIVGSRIWDVQSAFRIRLGPMGYQAFRQFMPQGSAMKKLCDLVRLYAGPALSFEVQPVLVKEEVPRTQLGNAAAGGSQLGWNTWLRSAAMTADAESAVFRSAN